MQPAGERVAPSFLVDVRTANEVDADPVRELALRGAFEDERVRHAGAGLARQHDVRLLRARARGVAATVLGVAVTYRGGR